jgi:hypothetical protein
MRPLPPIPKIGIIKLNLIYNQNSDDMATKKISIPYG